MFQFLHVILCQRATNDEFECVRPVMLIKVHIYCSPRTR